MDLARQACADGEVMRAALRELAKPTEYKPNVLTHKELEREVYRRRKIAREALDGTDY